MIEKNSKQIPKTKTLKKESKKNKKFSYQDSLEKRDIIYYQSSSRKKLGFSNFCLKEELLLGLSDLGFKFPSPIQEAVIPVALTGRDILARSKNGTGKTIAFLIPLLQKTNPKILRLQNLILVPTRELALQISNMAKRLSRFLNNLQIMVTTGGTSLKEDIIRIHQSIQILVGTPGRILDLVSKKENKFGECKMVVLDEADKLLSMEFYSIVNRILTNYLSQNRQIIFISATFPVAIKKVKNYLMKNPYEINLMKELTLKNVNQFYALVGESKKIKCLIYLFNKIHINQSIVFCNSVSRVELLAKKIIQSGMSCYFIHAKMSQNYRNRIFHDFRSGKCRNIVSSDLFTRGVDIQSVNLVINFDLPKSSETYLHRVGRTGRYGKEGTAISLITSEDKENICRIEQELGTDIKPIPNEKDF